ncbi:MAG: hypothetical protein H7Z40_13090 [Phycisphaerae bacterium]|nr:hypothetical protein [Gemmatimonadaceae bacterium]
MTRCAHSWKRAAYSLGVLSDTLLAASLISAGGVGGGGAAIAHRVGNHAFIVRAPVSTLWIDAVGVLTCAQGSRMT